MHMAYGIVQLALTFLTIMQQTVFLNSRYQMFSLVDTSGPQRVVESLTRIWSRALSYQANLAGIIGPKDIQPWIHNHSFGSLYVLLFAPARFQSLVPWL